MDTMKIKAVLAAVEHGSFSRAAEEFSYTPSAFSHMMSALEESLGVRLFDRSTTGVTLSAEGRALLPQMQALLESEGALERAAGELARMKKYELRIATYSSISRNLLSAPLKGFRRAYPNIKLSIRVADDLTGFLEKDLADIIFADDQVFSKCEWSPILEDRYFAVAPCEWLGERESITQEELYRYPHIYTDDQYLAHVFEKERFRELITFKSEDDFAVIDMVKEGMGIAVLPELVLRHCSAPVSILELSPTVTRTLGFAYKHARGESFALKRFIRYLKETLTEPKG